MRATENSKAPPRVPTALSGARDGFVQKGAPSKQQRCGEQNYGALKKSKCAHGVERLEWRSAEVLHNLHVGFDKRVRAKPGFVADQNASARAVDQHPQAAHISEIFEQVKCGGNIGRSRRGKVVVSFADQFIALISEQLAKAVRDANVLPVEVHDSGVDRGDEAFCKRLVDQTT